ncbi:hypothetical protein LX32DRAFT_647072 [Colletotrichum zoysiae]|uniref:Uncharacterized protein n=1 Tax=Colletotrichum zoysiae TaxID=1216348 RepID=A0AAD9H2X5_9PEZI|nr:hypothetical protein LX32DRAFT_647072 [Colletotrichum zoysiae]
MKPVGTTELCTLYPIAQSCIRCIAQVNVVALLRQIQRGVRKSQDSAIRLTPIVYQQPTVSQRLSYTTTTKKDTEAHQKRTLPEPYIHILGWATPEADVFVARD